MPDAGNGRKRLRRRSERRACARGPTRGGTTVVEGSSAGGLDAGATEGLVFPVLRGRFDAIGLAIVKNTSSAPIRIESAEVIKSSPDLVTTAARVWVIPPGTMTTLPVRAAGWPPPEAPLVKRLQRSAVIPPGMEAQFMFGSKSMAAVGSKVRVSGLRVRFSRDGKHYAWTLPMPIEMTTVRRPG